jgi:hypothetical protein
MLLGSMHPILLLFIENIMRPIFFFDMIKLISESLEEIKIFCPDSEHNGNQQNKHCVLNVSS